MLKIYIKEKSLGNLIVIALICMFCMNFIGCTNPNTSTTATNTNSNAEISENVEKLNSETKNKLLTSLLSDLKAIDSSYDKIKVNSLSNANRGSYMNDIGEKYIALIEKTYNSIADLENDKEKLTTEKQTALSNVKKACDDIEISYKKAGGGSGAGTDIPYAKMNSARQEICNELKKYFGCSDDLLVWNEMKDDSPKESNTNISTERTFEQRKKDIILDYRVALNAYIKAEPPIYENSYEIYKIKPIKCDEAYYVGCIGYPYVFRLEYNKKDKEAQVMKLIKKDTDYEFLEN